MKTKTQTPAKPKRKYLTEFGVNMHATNSVLLQQEDLSRLHQLLPADTPPFHIYFICRRPRITVDPDQFKVSQTQIAGRFLVHDGPKEIPFDFVCGNSATNPITAIHSSWPHNMLELRGTDGSCVYGGKTALLAPHFNRNISPYVDLEVMYIGQSFGDDGKRVAATRLQGHETLQMILGEASRLSPDKEIWLLLASFEPMLVMTFDGRTSTQLDTTQEEDDAHMARVIANPISEAQQINFTEAALIRYFEPSFNEHFKRNFPNPAHSTYRECYDLDLNSVFIEIDTEGAEAQLYSPAVDRAWQHIRQFELHNASERALMLDVLMPGMKKE